MEPKSVSKSVRKTGITTVAAVIMTALVIGSLIAVTSHLYGIQTVAVTASADKVKVEEFFGTATAISTTTSTTDEPISGCVTLRTVIGTATFSGIIDGTATSVNKQVRDACIGHSSLRVLYKFSSVTIKPDPFDASTWKTGGLVLETIVQSEFPPSTPTAKTESQNRILCGTGDLKHIHGEGVSKAVPLAYAIWIHFGHNHDVGFDFLCEDL